MPEENNGYVKVVVKSVNKVYWNGLINGDKIATLYAVPMYKGKKIIGYKEAITGKPIVDHLYLGDGESFNEEDSFYIYNRKKWADGRRLYHVGDVCVEVKDSIKIEKLKKYLEQDPADMLELIAELPYLAIKENCSGYSEDKDLEYYNKDLVLYYLNDEPLVLVPKRTFDKTDIAHYKELVTGKKIIKRAFVDGVSEFDYLFEHGQLEIPEVDPSFIATRELTPAQFDEYLNKTELDIKLAVLNYYHQDQMKKKKNPKEK